MRVREKNDLGHWFRFFLTGVCGDRGKTASRPGCGTSTAKENGSIDSGDGSRASNAQKFMHQLYQRPVTDADKVSKAAGISLPTAYFLIEALESKGIVREVTGGQCMRMYIFDEYLKLFR